MTLSGSVFINRVNRNDALKAFGEAIERVKRERQSVFIFPEGTRSYYLKPGLLPFKKGAFHFAVQAGIPLVPFVVSNYSKIFSFKTKTFQSGTIEIELLPPIDTSNMTAEDVNNLVEKVHKDMLAVAEKLQYGPSVPSAVAEKPIKPDNPVKEELATGISTSSTTRKAD